MARPWKVLALWEVIHTFVRLRVSIRVISLLFNCRECVTIPGFFLSMFV